MKGVPHFYKAIRGYFHFAQVYIEAVARAEPGDLLVEVGVWRGKSAAFLAVEAANSGKGLKLALIDLWDGREMKHQAPGEDLFNTVRRNLAPVLDGRAPVEVELVRRDSAEAATLYPDGSAAFIFLDAGHGYESVKRDLAAWLPKLKPGGLIAGDDWNWKGVQQAVTEALGPVEIRREGNSKSRYWVKR